MKILVFSDSHGKSAPMSQIIERNLGHIQTVIFLGDYIRDIAPLESVYTDIQFLKISGNCDFCGTAPDEMIAEFNGVKILLTHGHHYGVKTGHDRIRQTAASRGLAACFFGHTHMPLNRRDSGILLLNPGSIAHPRGNSRASFAMVEISNGEIVANIAEAR
ncbi:MAG: metallophosphoesterase [Defluviitaleaceae bacterium]|nr:metallophosphoesterase [Defluviitaleaceae bacterium]